MNIDKVIAETQARAKGWGLDSYDEGSTINGHFVYLSDKANNKMLMLNISDSDFQQMPIQIASADILSSGIAEHARDIMIHGATINSTYGALLTAYIKSTRAYSQAIQQGIRERIHFLINIYNQDQPTIRPAIVGANQSLMDYERIKEVSNYIYQQDKKHNPHWFNKTRN